jgi:hypothetical protein
VLKLEKWNELDDLFDQCWKYKSPDHYETLADLVLVIHACMTQAGVEEKYQKSKPRSAFRIMEGSLTSCRGAFGTPEDYQPHVSSSR